MIEAARVLAVFEVAVIVASGALLFGQYAREFPGPVRAAGYAVGLFVFLVGAAIVLNATTDTAVTPGLGLLAWAALPVAAVVGYGAWWSWRQRP